MLPHVKIDSVADSIPDEILTSLELEKKISEKSPGIFLPPGIIELLTGVKERRRRSPTTNASDLASDEGKLAMDKIQIKKNQIDCMIFAAASGDITEPATANIVQQKLGLTCPVFDIKNACNSFITAIQVAESLITANTYKRILITNGEVPSLVVRESIKDKNELRKSFAGYTFGDAGAAMILSKSDGVRGILWSIFNSYGEHWQKSTVLGGGSMYPQSLDKHYFEGETAGLKDIFIQIGPKQLFDTLEHVGWKMEDVSKIIVHQVSAQSFELLVKKAKIPKEKLVIVLPYLGNMIAASIPVALSEAEKTGQIKKGDKLILIGLASGISIATMAVIW